MHFQQFLISVSLWMAPYPGHKPPVWEWDCGCTHPIYNMRTLLWIQGNVWVESSAGHL